MKLAEEMEGGEMRETAYWDSGSAFSLGRYFVMTLIVAPRRLRLPLRWVLLGPALGRRVER